MKLFRNKNRMMAHSHSGMAIHSVVWKGIWVIMFFWAVFPVIIYAQNDNSKVTANFETFDIECFNKLKGDDGLREGVLSDGTLVSCVKFEDSIAYNIYTSNSHFGLNKSYYSNGNIKNKGLLFINGGIKNSFRVGVWYFFDQEGNLTEEKDYEKPYTFTLEEMLTFTHEKGIDLPKIPEILESGEEHPWIDRNYNEKTKESWWELGWVKEDDQRYTESIRLDGETGEVYLKEITFRGRRARYDR